MAEDRTGSIAQTLPGLTSVLTGVIDNPDDRFASIDQTLGGLISAATGTYGPGAVTATIAQTLPGIVQSMRGVGFAMLTDSVIATDFYLEYAVITEPLITDAVEASDSTFDFIAEAITDSVIASDTVTDQATVLEVISDQAVALDAYPEHVVIDSIADTVEASDSVTSSMSDAVIDSVIATDSVPVFTYTEVISDVVIASDSSPALWLDSVSDVVLASDRILGETRIVLEIIADTVEVTDSVISYANASDQILDVVIALDSAQSAPSTIFSSVTDTAIALDYVYSLDPNSIAWVVNTESGAPWFFDNFQFTSMIEHAGMLLGTGLDGLYYISGENDAGSEISSEIITGMLDFDFPNKKHVPNIYFGYTGGELEIEVESYNEREPNDIYSYSATRVDAVAPANTRIKLGKGLNSRYWRITLRNVAGAAFQVYDKLADVVASKRRL